MACENVFRLARRPRQVGHSLPKQHFRRRGVTLRGVAQEMVNGKLRLHGHTALAAMS